MELSTILGVSRDVLALALLAGATYEYYNDQPQNSIFLVLAAIFINLF